MAATAGHKHMERARAILRIFWELSTAAVTLCNIWRPYHGTRQNRQPRYILKYLHLAAESIADCLSLQNAINLQLFIPCRCNQLLIVCTDEIKLIRNCLRRQNAINCLLFIFATCNQLLIVYAQKVQLICDCLYRQNAINCLLFISTNHD